MIGASVIASTSRIVFTDAFDKSTAMPRRFISRTIICWLMETTPAMVELKIETWSADRGKKNEKRGKKKGKQFKFVPNWCEINDLV